MWLMISYITHTTNNNQRPSYILIMALITANPLVLITVPQLDHKLLETTVKKKLDFRCAACVANYRHIEYKTIGITHDWSHSRWEESKKHDQQSICICISRLNTLTFFRFLLRFNSILINILIVGVLCPSHSDQVETM